MTCAAYAAPGVTYLGPAALLWVRSAGTLRGLRRAQGFALTGILARVLHIVIKGRGFPLFQWPLSLSFLLNVAYRPFNVSFPHPSLQVPPNRRKAGVYIYVKRHH